MILIGQYDSSFVRRVGIALTLYDLSFEHRPWSVFSDFEALRGLNPTGRVPVLVLDDDEVLIDTHAILDHLDTLVAPERRLVPAEGPARRHSLKVSALASQLADTAVSLFYEKVLHEAPSPVLVERRGAQLLGGLAALEAERNERRTTHWFGERIGHADIAVAAAIRHTRDSHPDLVDLEAYPALARHCAALEALPVFTTISQPFLPPA
ncbi:MAG: glutathione S-transferase family protein [Rhizobiaceae bacterium]|nr:glutathione S-transferase family protein [Rhizobiaceae bacterium]MCV0405419.1 glutathione S-transferase family protein [Rhizobiaceae bacterium]